MNFSHPFQTQFSESAYRIEMKNSEGEMIPLFEDSVVYFIHKEEAEQELQNLTKAHVDKEFVLTYHTF